MAVLLAFPVGVLAGATFNDVPTSHPFYNDIEALVASGVTAGCGGGNYCPNANVTRAQMAAFMNRLGALQAGKTPVVNAAKLGGLDQSAFHRYTSSAPYGSVQYGNILVAGVASGASQFDAGSASYPVPLLSDPTPHVITPGDPVPTGCSGSATSPSASAGHLCIWITYELNVSGSYDVYGDDGLLGPGRRGFLIDAFSAGAGNFVAAGVWAVGGPLATLPLSTQGDSGPSIGSDQ